MSENVAQHVPVLLNAALAALRPIAGVWVDCTLGAGGYARALLDNGARCVIGIDRDPEACRVAADTLADRQAACIIVNDRFGAFDRLPAVQAAAPIDGVVFDLGISSMQLEDAQRGFSFRLEGPLDMRMDATGMTAARFINTASEGDLTRVLRQYGEEHEATRIARHIARERTHQPIETTVALAGLVERCLAHRHPGPIHRATRTFQALRIHINDELGELRAGLDAAARVLRAGGKLAVISFHSLEDKLVKSFLQPAHRSNRHHPAPAEGKSMMRAMGKLIRPDADEIARNVRSRSARLRIGCKVSAGV